MQMIKHTSYATIMCEVSLKSHCFHIVQDFDVAALEKFIDASSTPRVVTFDKNPDNHPYLLKFFQSSATKVRTRNLFLKYLEYYFYRYIVG